MKIQQLILVVAMAMSGAVGWLPAAEIAPALDVKQKLVEYRDGDAVLEGVLVFNAAAPTTTKLPGVIVVPDWLGVGPFAIERAGKLAGMGYIALVADIYGKGVRPTNAQEAGAQAGKYKQDRALLRSRVNAALAVLRDRPGCDAGRLAAIGYCFGGTTVLELARSGAEVAAFQEEMRAAKVNWEVIAYSGAVHSFTNPQAGTDPAKGVAYNEQADRRSWQRLTAFLRELFPQ